MISYVKGQIIKRSDKFLVIETGGIGYKVYCTNDLISSSQDQRETDVWTYLAVRENSLDLYGFSSEEELGLFELLITVSGVGPKTALGILNVSSTASLRKAISTGETNHLTKVSGIGKKVAEKIVLELKGKLTEDTGGEIELKEELDAIEALKSLGYSHKDAREALKEIESNLKTTSERVKAALKHLGK